jgi:hypothetical protein
MTRIPHDVVDLALAPVALHLEDRLESLGGLDDHELSLLLALETDHEPRTVAERREALLSVLGRGDHLHGWVCSWSARGLVVRHSATQLTLGLPPALRSYLRLG